MRDKDEIVHAFRYNLLDAINDNGTNQAKLAHAAGASANAVHLYCHGKSVPTLVPLVRIADALGVTVDELVRPRNGKR
jgi:transcriptional regulator with XRE-family HTH domain